MRYCIEVDKQITENKAIMAKVLTCKTCKYWQLSHPNFSLDDWNHQVILGRYSNGKILVQKSEQQAIVDTGYAARWCTRFLKNDRPEQDSVSLFGAYDEGSAMATGGDFGCIQYQPISQYI